MANWLENFGINRKPIDVPLLRSLSTPLPDAFNAQGLICKEIPMWSVWTTKDDPQLYAEAARNFASWAFYNANFVPGEFPREAMAALAFNNYVGSLYSEGHVYFIESLMLNPFVMDGVREALSYLGAHEYIAVFDSFTNLVKDIPVKTLLENEYGRYKSVYEKIRKLDDEGMRLAHSENDHGAELGLWLKQQLSFKLLNSTDEFDQERARLFPLNEMREVRLKALYGDRLGRARQERLDSSSGRRIRKLCERQGLELTDIDEYEGIIFASGGRYYERKQADGTIVLAEHSVKYSLPDPNDPIYW